MCFLTDLTVALTSNVPFGLAWKRVKHIRYGHPFEESELIEKLRSEKHPHSDDEMVYTVNIRQCNDCGLTYFDEGLEYRNR